MSNYRPPNHICRRCGRKGIRGFVIYRQLGQGRDFGNAEWECAHRTACEARQRKAERI